MAYISTNFWQVTDFWVLNWALLTAIIFVASVVFYLLLEQVKQIGKGLPPVITGWVPFIGMGIEFGKHPLNCATRLYKKYGEIFTVKVMGQRLTFLVGPEAHAHFFRSSDEDVSQEEPYKFAVPIFGPGVVYDAPLPTRVQQLRFLSNSLKVSRMKTYVDQIVQETEAYFSNWGDSGEIDLRDELSNLIILTASRCLMGPEIRNNLHDKVASLYQTLDEGLTTISFFAPYLPIPQHRRRDKARIEMRNLYASVMKKRRQNPDEEHEDVLQMLMNATYKDGTPLSDDVITGMMIALLFAGQHTSSITGSWTGLLLLKNKKFLPAVLKEQEDVLAEFDGKLSMGALNKMDHLHRCVKEALRMYPPLIMLMRYLHTGFKYKNYYVPAGDTLFVSPALSHRCEHVFKDANSYDPDRFGPGREEDKKAPFSFVGFGGGRHGCMGEQFAYLQIKSIWSVLLRNFEMEVVGDLPEPDYQALVVGPKQPCRIRYKRKKTAA